jgi:hypothetical protein
MKTEKKSTNTEKKRLSLDDFKVDQVNHLGKVAATDLSSLFGGSSQYNCCMDMPTGGGQDDCHS